ncbi:MAG: hypothetical protein ACM3MF_03315 [Anaerolineae bacterium]
MSLVTPRLLSRILDGYALRPNGVHGIAHWARVLENGRRVGALTPGADPDVIELFAVFHDSRRVNDAIDRGHGRRGAELARELRGDFFEIDDARFALLQAACNEHTAGKTQADPSVQVCWDSDRLDLLRVGIRPVPFLLCTPSARLQEVMDWANNRATTFYAPPLIKDEWGIDLV